MTCPRCGSNRAYNNGLTPAGSQRYKCADCRKTWTIIPKKTGRPILGHPMTNAERQRRYQARQRKKFQKDTNES